MLYVVSWQILPEPFHQFHMRHFFLPCARSALCKTSRPSLYIRAAADIPGWSSCLTSRRYASVDRQYFFSTLWKLGLDGKTTRLSQATLRNTTAKVTSRGEFSESFPIRVGVREGDGLSCNSFQLHTSRLSENRQLHYHQELD